MEDNKWFLKSKTLWGVIIMALPGLLQVFGVSLTADEHAALGQMGDKVLEALGAALAIYGRFVAGGSLTLK